MSASVGERVPVAVSEGGRPDRTRSVRRLVLAVALVAIAHGLLWSVLVPPFQAPDETEHFAYAQFLAETAKLPPQAGHPQYSAEEVAVIDALGTTGITGNYLGRPPASALADRTTDEAIRLAGTLPRGNGGGPSTASAQPPLAYALWVIPYRLGESGTLLTRLWLMRLLSVLWFAATAVGVTLLARELLPSWSWAGPVAGLLVALQPSLAFISVSVNPDTMLFAVSTWALLLAIQSVRHGLTRRRAVLLGALVGAGMVTKLTFAGIVPGFALALLLGLLRTQGPRVRLAATAIGTAAILPVAYLLWVVLSGRGLLPPGAGNPVLPPEQQLAGSLPGLLSYGWQLYLPRLPFMHDFFGFFPPYSLWVTGFVGRLGWLDYGLSSWIYPTGGVVLGAALVLVVVALARLDRVRRHWRELVVFALLGLGLGLQIAAAGYGYFNQTGFRFEQARYLYPLIGLYGVGLVVACTAVGRRFAPALAAGLVGLASLHTLAAIFSTVARYYG